MPEILIAVVIVLDVLTFPVPGQSATMYGLHLVLIAAVLGVFVLRAIFRRDD